MNEATVLPHQKLDSYKVAREICLRVYAAKISNAKLRDQAERAGSGMFLQLAEGLPIAGAGLRKKYFTEALGSLHELVAALDLAAVARFMNAKEAAAIIVLAERERRMLLGLLQPRSGGRVAEPAETP
jgi:four helix bundle protein